VEVSTTVDDSVGADGSVDSGEVTGESVIVAVLVETSANTDVDVQPKNSKCQFRLSAIF